MAHFVYILRSIIDQSYYIGSTANPEERLTRHNQGRSQYTKSKRPWEMIFIEEFPDRSAATKRENEIKSRKSKAYIEKLIRTSRQS